MAFTTALSSKTSLVGTALPARTHVRRTTSQVAVPTQAGVFKPNTQRRGQESEVVRNKRLLPYDEKLARSIPDKAQKMWRARNLGDAQKTMPAGKYSSRQPPGVIGVAVGIIAVWLISTAYFASQSGIAGN